MNPLFLMYNHHIVGSFTPDENLRLDFLYEDSWLRNENSFPISISMPLQKQAHTYPTPNTFLENLMPEEKIRAAIEGSARLPKNSPYQFLKEFGDDLAGAFVISSNPSYTENWADIVELPYSYLDRAIDEGRNIYQSVSQDYGVRFSLAGAQDKFCTILKNDSLYLSKGNLPSSHIAKVNLDFRNSQTVYNEFFCMNLAKKSGLKVPAVRIVGAKHPILLIERYDRKKEDGKILRLHQEDFCQAQAYSSGLKYQDKGGPSIAQNYKVIKENCHQPLKSLDSFLDWIAFNLIIGNNDSHSKNLSLIYQGRTQSLAPFYDLLSTAVYGDRFSKTFAFKIGGTYQHDKIRPPDIEQLENSLGIKKGKFIKNFARIAKKIEERLAYTEAKLKEIAPQNTIGARISNLVKVRLKHFRTHGKLDI